MSFKANGRENSNITNFLHVVMINPDERFSPLCLYQKIIFKKKPIYAVVLTMRELVSLDGWLLSL